MGGKSAVCFVYLGSDNIGRPAHCKICNKEIRGDDIYKKVEVLSPGERSRVALAKVALKGANTLLLDEPTNHLDPMTQVIIADTFKTYEGTMLVVSHNLDFVDNLGISRMLLLPSGKIVYYDRDIVYHYEMINENK